MPASSTTTWTLSTSKPRTTFLEVVRKLEPHYFQYSSLKVGGRSAWGDLRDHSSQSSGEFPTILWPSLLSLIQALNRTSWFESVEGQECNSHIQRIMNSRYFFLAKDNRLKSYYIWRMSPTALAWVRKTVWFICTARFNHFTHVHFPLTGTYSCSGMPLWSSPWP